MKINSDTFYGFNDYKELAELLPQIVYETDLQGNITYTNHVAFELFRYPLDTPYNELNIFNMLIPDDLDRAKRDVKMALQNEIPDGVEYTGLRKDGTTFPIKIFSSQIIKDGEVKGIRGIILDITLEKKIQSINKENEKRFHSLFENMGSCCVILNPANNGEDFILIDINRQAEIFSKVEKSDILGKNFQDILFRFKGSDIINILKRVWNTGKEERYSYFKYENNKIIFWIDAHIFKLPSGEIVLVYDNITNAKKTKESLMESKTKYEILFDSNPCYMVLLDTDGVLADVNKSMLDLAGLTKDDVIGTHFKDFDVLIEEDKSSLKENFPNVFTESGEHDPLMIRLVDKKGEIHWVKTYLTTVDFMGEILYILAINVDITKQKIYDDKLRAALNDKNILIKEIHHRVKNNMQIISSLLNLQKNFIENDTEATNILLESQNRVRAMALVHEKLYQSDNLTEINIQGYITNLVNELLYSYGVPKQILQNFKVDDIVLGIETAIPLGLIITELSSNSIKYAFPQGANELFIGLKHSNDSYEFVFRDNGPGLPLDFDIEKSKSLGLVLVNNLVEQLEGKITVNNDNGAEFKIIFKELDYPTRI